MSMSLPPVDSTYSQILNSFFGYVSEEDKAAFWNRFLVAKGAKASPNDFLEYVQTAYECLSMLNLSPEEIARRHVLFNIFDIIILLMRTIQDTVGSEADHSLFLTKMQKQYTEAMSRVPIYISGVKGEMKVSRDTLGAINDITFGYDQVSLTDIATYLTQVVPGKYDPAKPQNSTFMLGCTTQQDSVSSFTVYTKPYLKFIPTLTETPAGSGTYTNTGGTIELYVDAYYTAPLNSTHQGQRTDKITSITVTNPEDLESWKQASQTLLTPYLGQTTDSNGITHDVLHVAYTYGPNPIDIKQPLVVYWQFSDTRASNPGISAESLDQITKNRGARNKRSQQYIGAIKTKSSLVSEALSTIQSDLKNSINARKSFTSILTSSLQQLRNILDGIFSK